jgi:hypothetical protein
MFRSGNHAVGLTYGAMLLGAVVGIAFYAGSCALSFEDNTKDNSAGGTGSTSSPQGSNGSGASPCSDGKQNGDETDVDCGGNCLKRCETDQKCNTPTDCQSSICTGGKCVVPTCSDSIKNGNEGDIDCGGMCPNRCGDGQACAVAGDCQNGVCTDMKCQAPTCSDGFKNGTETSADCGSGCPLKCYGQSCSSNGDCNSKACGGGLCRFAIAVPCTEDAECATIFCKQKGAAKDGTCALCTQDGDCKSQQCQQANGICKIETGAPCSGDGTACAIGQCNNNLCVFFDGANCSVDAECLGLHCASDSDGGGPFCTVCKDNGDCTAVKDGICNATSGKCLLPAGAYCGPSTNQCVAGKPCTGFPSKCQ